MTTLRSARGDDLPAVIDIYNYEVEHGVATFDTVPWTLEDRAPGSPPMPPRNIR